VNNPLAHQLTTAREIIEAVASTPPTPVHPSSGKVDAFIAGVGTGGTISGVAKGIKEVHNPDCIVVGVDPVGRVLFLETVSLSLHVSPQVGSSLAPTSLNETGTGHPYVVEGIGYDFWPDVLTREPGMIDEWVKTNDKDAFAAIQLLMRHEGTLVGGSSGSALAGALAWLRSESGREISQARGKNVVIILADGCVREKLSHSPLKFG
jgi:cystathionine beta-synthase